MSYEVTFTDNMEVTLDNMNDIAKDLGDTEFSEFSTNKFGVDALNSITSDLVSSGILRTEANANMGCVPVISNTNVIIGTGVIVFATGAKLRITEQETFTKVNSTYIYAKNDHTTGISSLVMSETAPTNNMDSVPLCRVDANGILHDMRSAAVAKLSFTAEPQNIGLVKRIVHDSMDINNTSFDVELGFNGWKYIIYTMSSSSIGRYREIIKLEDGDSMVSGFPINNTNGDFASGTTVTRHGSVLHFEYTDTHGSSGNFNVEIELR